MATAVLQVQDIKPFQHEIMNASPLGGGQERTRHGRSKHGSNQTKTGRARGASFINVDERGLAISKALVWIFKHGVNIELQLDDEGFGDCEELVSYGLQPTGKYH